MVLFAHSGKVYKKVSIAKLMARIEIKKINVTTSCACGHNAKYRIDVKGNYATPQSEMPLCEGCFKELKEKIVDF